MATRISSWGIGWKFSAPSLMTVRTITIDTMSPRPIELSMFGQSWDAAAPPNAKQNLPVPQYWLVLCAALLCALPTTAQETASGAKQFAARCAGCHGVDGNGGEFGPGILDVRRSGGGPVRNVRDTITNGVPESGMPPFTLPQQDLDALATFVEGLRAPAAIHPAAGDVRAGESFFFGKGNCGSCHMVAGRGGTLGPDLSNLGRE